MAISNMVAALIPGVLERLKSGACAQGNMGMNGIARGMLASRNLFFAGSALAIIASVGALLAKGVIVFFAWPVAILATAAVGFALYRLHGSVVLCESLERMRAAL